MGIVYSLYDALVSINVPNDKAKAVIDAMERELMDKVATKSDLKHVQELLSKDVQTEVAKLGRTLTTQLYLAIGGAVVLNCSILGTLLVLLR